MKVEATREPDIFKPIVLTVTITSCEELYAIKALCARNPAVPGYVAGYGAHYLSGCDESDPTFVNVKAFLQGIFRQVKDYK